MKEKRRLRASQKDLRSPNNAKKRTIDRFTPSQVPEIMSVCDDDEQFVIKLHVTLKCRILAYFALDWSKVRWKDEFYGFPMTTIDVYESKGNVWWKHCPRRSLVWIIEQRLERTMGKVKVSYLG